MVRKVWPAPHAGVGLITDQPQEGELRRTRNLETSGLLGYMYFYMDIVVSLADKGQKHFFLKYLISWSMSCKIRSFPFTLIILKYKNKTLFLSFSLKDNKLVSWLSNGSHVFPNDNISFHSSVAGEKKRKRGPYNPWPNLTNNIIFLTKNMTTATSCVCVSTGRRMCTSSITKLKIHLTVRCFKWESWRRQKKNKKNIMSCREFFLMISVYVAVLRCGSVEFWTWTVLDPPSRTKLNIQVKSRGELVLCFMPHPFCGKYFPCTFGYWLWCVESEKRLYCIYVRSHYVYSERSEVRSWILDVKQQPCLFP